MIDDQLAPVLERLTGQARRALAKAVHEAHANHDDYVGTEHVLLGLLHETHSGAGALLRSLGADPDRMLRQIHLLLRRQTTGPSVERLPLTPGVRRALAWAADEATAARQSYVGPEHVLLGLGREEESLAHFLLDEAGVGIEALRDVLPRLPPLENRDQLVQAPLRPGGPLRADPTLAELEKLLACEPVRAIPGAMPSAAVVHAPARGIDHQDLQNHLRSVQLILAVFAGAAVGATLDLGFMVLCIIAGAVLGVVRSSFLGAFAGAWAGFGLARAVCPGRWVEGLLVILAAILAGVFIGDWPLRLLDGYRRHVAEDEPEA